MKNWDFVIKHYKQLHAYSAKSPPLSSPPRALLTVSLGKILLVETSQAMHFGTFVRSHKFKTKQNSACQKNENSTGWHFKSGSLDTVTCFDHLIFSMISRYEWVCRNLETTYSNSGLKVSSNILEPFQISPQRQPWRQRKVGVIARYVERGV